MVRNERSWEAALDGYFESRRPDVALVQGDTTTAFCGALAAFYRRVPTGHVEAGLRTHDMMRPWPEEANRVLVSRLAAMHFAPTEGARRELLAEGLSEADIVVTGNTVVDALFLAVERVRRAPPDLGPLERAGADGRPLVLITGHRRESFGEGFESICAAIAELAGRFPGADFVYPVHLNPRVREPVERILGPLERAGNVILTEPMAYLPFVALMDRSTLVLTDSGGIQEEAPSLGKPVLVMRETTERPEAVEAGTVRLVGTDRERIVEGVTGLLTERALRERMSRAHNPYGDGRAAGRIVEALAGRFAR